MGLIERLADFARQLRLIFISQVDSFSVHGAEIPNP